MQHRAGWGRGVKESAPPLTTPLFPLGTLGSPHGWGGKAGVGQPSVEGAIKTDLRAKTVRQKVEELI